MNYKLHRNVLDKGMANMLLQEIIRVFTFDRVEVVNMSIGRACGGVNKGDKRVEDTAHLLSLGLSQYMSFNDFSIVHYRNGEDWVDWHSDGEYLRKPKTQTGTISLGATRDVLFRKKGSEEIETVTLNHGDVLVMDENCQDIYEHMVPKCEINKPRYVMALYTRKED